MRRGTLPTQGRSPSTGAACAGCLLLAAFLGAALLGACGNEGGGGKGGGAGDTASGLPDNAAGPDDGGPDTATADSQPVDAPADTASVDTASPPADVGEPPDDGAPDDPGTPEADLPVTVDTVKPPEDAGPDDAGGPDLEYDAEGCLTFAGASTLCGYKSDKAVCALAATCREDGNASQCSIDCEMSPTMGCLDKSSVKCVLDAVAGKDCEALAGCAGWYLVY